MIPSLQFSPFLLTFFSCSCHFDCFWNITREEKKQEEILGNIKKKKKTNGFSIWSGVYLILLSSANKTVPNCSNNSFVKKKFFPHSCTNCACVRFFSLSLFVSSFIGEDKSVRTCILFCVKSRTPCARARTITI